MAVIALPVLATTLLSRRYDEAASLADMELGALRQHAPAPQHAYARLLRTTLADFKVMKAEECR